LQKSPGKVLGGAGRLSVTISPVLLSARAVKVLADGQSLHPATIVPHAKTGMRKSFRRFCFQVVCVQSGERGRGGNFLFFNRFPIILLRSDSQFEIRD
jgi:hypothetical protein